jgi:glycosyltransferase involved in cell wall biosynthesis
MDKKVILSIVTTMYKSSPYIDEFYTKITDDYEIIFVDDGSPDNSLQKAVELYEKDKKVKVIELSRNFGHHKSMMTGLSHAKGEFVFLIDSDLEEKPELCQNIKELHFQAYEQYKNDFPKNIENIEYFEKRYNFYLNSINQINKDTEKNQDNYKSYCNKFDASVKFNFIEILPESNFSYVGIGK